MAEEKPSLHIDTDWKKQAQEEKKRLAEEEARKAKYQGTCVLWLVVGPDGRPRDIRVARSLGLGLDEKAIEAVKTWKFEPAMKDGKPVAVQINVEVSFRLY